MIKSFSLIGSEAVVAQLLALPEKIRIKVERDAVAEANKILIGTIREQAPVRCGALRRSIDAKLVRYSGGRIVIGIVGPRSDFIGNLVVNQKTKKKSFKKTAKSASVKGTVKPSKYAHLVEGGTKQGAKPNPFMQRALDSNRQQIINIFEEAVKEAVASG